MGFWQISILSSESWMRLMNGLRIFLTCGGALLLIYEARSRALGYHQDERLKKRIAVVMSALSIGAYFYFFNPNVRYPDYYHRHEFFHQYTSAKYAEEIGYDRLYQCAAIAEIELGRGADVRKRDELRDLTTNQLVRLEQTYVLDDPDRCKKHFSAEKWESFKHDMDWFYSTARGSYWDNLQKDHGANNPPVWKLTAKFFASFGTAGDKFFKVLCVLDILLLIGMSLSIFWAFGWRIGAIATVFWGCNAPADFYWTGGAFLRQDWLFLLVLSLCLARKRMFVLAGFALMWSALIRIFPIIFFTGWAIIIGWYVLGRLRDPARERGVMKLLHPDHRRLIAGSVLALGLLVPASVIVIGPNSYPEFARRLLVVERTQLTSNMGLETVLVHEWDNRMRFTRDDNRTDPFEVWKSSRNERHGRLLWLKLAITAAVFGWMVWALRRTKLLWLGPPLALPLVVCLTNFSCYYYSMFLIAALLALARPNLGPVLLVTSGASQIVLLSFYWVDDKFAAQAWLYFIASVLLLVGFSRFRRVSQDLDDHVVDAEGPGSGRAGGAHQSKPDLGRTEERLRVDGAAP